jgi:hypothetical protein
MSESQCPAANERLKYKQFQQRRPFYITNKVCGLSFHVIDRNSSHILHESLQVLLHASFDRYWLNVDHSECF